MLKGSRNCRFGRNQAMMAVMEEQRAQHYDDDYGGGIGIGGGSNIGKYLMEEEGVGGGDDLWE